jgi:hypothetical protein
LLAEDRDTIAVEVRAFLDDDRGHGQRVPAAGVGDSTDDHDFFPFADTMDQGRWMGGGKVGGKSLAADGWLEGVRNAASSVINLAGG